MTCDSFTSTWQNELFESYEVSPVQAMCGVNFFSFLLTSVSLLQQASGTVAV
jgi:adenosine 3'-phospho 5'-phosphosulfate transporter B2